MSPVIPDSQVLQDYLSDESGIFRANPDQIDALHLPESSGDVARILRQAHQSGTTCTVSGAGTGITGGRVPVTGGAIVSLQNLRTADDITGWESRTDETGSYRICVDSEAGLARVPAGIPLAVLDEMLPQDWMYPPDPTEKTASVGGTIATNASGARSFAFGPTRTWVQGLHIVLPQGDSLALGRGTITANADGIFRLASEAGTEYRIDLPSYQMPEVKNAAGLYAKPGMDLVDLFVGSEGILGVITQATLKLVSRPSDIQGAVLFFADEGDAISLSNALRMRQARDVFSIEYFDHNSLLFLEQDGQGLPRGGKAAVFCEVKEEALEWLAEASEKLDCVDDWLGASQRDIKRLKDFRHALPEGINSYLRQTGSSKMGTDFAVPPQSFPAMLDAYRSAGGSFGKAFPRQGFHTAIFGHIGDCHLHMNFLTQSDAERDYVKQQYLALAQKAVSCGGTISAEHGVGKRRIELDGQSRPYLELMYGKKGLAEIAAVKRVLDPNWVLNPGNMVDPG